MGRVRVVIILILGMVALGFLTWGIGKIYLELLGQSNRVQNQRAQTSQEGTNPDNTIVLVLPEVTFWTCQVGVFQNESNARLSKEKLKMLGFKGEVINSNPWVVGVGLGHSASELIGLRTALADRGISTMPKQILLPERTFRVVGNSSQPTVELLKKVNGVLRKGGGAEAFAEKDLLWDTEAGNHPPKDLEKLYQYYNAFRSKTTSEEQIGMGLSIFYESERVINLLSGK